MCSGSEAGSYLRLIDFCITQLEEGEHRILDEIALFGEDEPHQVEEDRARPAWGFGFRVSGFIIRVGQTRVVPNHHQQLLTCRSC